MCNSLLKNRGLINAAILALFFISCGSKTAKDPIISTKMETNQGNTNQGNTNQEPVLTPEPTPVQGAMSVIKKIIFMHITQAHPTQKC